MTTYLVTLTGKTPLLMSNLSVEWQDRIQDWIKDPANKGVSRNGDDRTPAWGWLGRLYYDNGFIIVPADNLNACFAEGARAIILKGNTTYQRVVCAGMRVKEFYWPVLVDGKPIGSQQFLDLIDKGDSKEDHEQKHCSLASKNGFELWPKHVTLTSGSKKIKVIRVRPRFNQWKVSGYLEVFDDRLTPAIVKQILDHAGSRAGLCDWRPGSPSKPGHYGMFEVEISPVVDKAAKTVKSK